MARCLENQFISNDSFANFANLSWFVLRSTRYLFCVRRVHSFVLYCQVCKNKSVAFEIVSVSLTVSFSSASNNVKCFRFYLAEDSFQYR